MKKTILLCLGMTILGYGGSKAVAPVDAIVEPIPLEKKPLPIYVGLGLTWGQYDDCGGKCTYEDVTFGTTLRAGYEFNQYVGIEARMIATFIKRDKEGGESLRHMGVFLKPMYPFLDRLNAYGLLGYGWTRTFTGSSLLPTVDEGGFSAGAGLEFDISSRHGDKVEDTLYQRGFDGYADQEKGWGLFVDYQRLLIKSNTPDMDVVSGGITYDF